MGQRHSLPAASEIMLEIIHLVHGPTSDPSSRLHFHQVFDVMLQSISSPRAEGASPPLQDVPNSKKALTLASLQLALGFMQLQAISCSSTRSLISDPTPRVKPGLHSCPPSREYAELVKLMYQRATLDPIFARNFHLRFGVNFWAVFPFPDEGLRTGLGLA
jgi:hypothetical protein